MSFLSKDQGITLLEGRTRKIPRYMICFGEETTVANKAWYLVHCQPRRIYYAAKALNQLYKLSIFLPEMRIQSHGEVRQIPFFPGYLFAHVDLQEMPLGVFHTCPGVLHLVEFGGEAQRVPHTVIETIIQQLEHVSNENALSCHHFAPGDIVSMKRGPLQDLNMIFIGSMRPSGRVRVLLEILGRLKEVQVDVDTLEKVSEKASISPQSCSQRVRLTRGKGRRIHNLPF